jgi:hypothetical protein
MNFIQTKIGEHCFLIKSDSNKLTAFLARNFLCRIHVPKQLPDMIITIHEGYGVPFKNYNVTTIEELNNVSFIRADYHLKVSVDYKQADLFVHDEFALKHALMNLYSSFIVHHQWGLLLHSSCAVEDGKAHIFTGHSGAGKSTAAKLSQPRQLLSDEAAILKITKEEISVFNSPFRSEIEAEGENETYTLRSIQLLHQSQTNQRIQLKKSEALLHLMDKVFYWSYKSEETTKILGLLKELINHVTVYELHFQKNNTFWELIS